MKHSIVRRMREDDLEQVLAWRNDPLVRRNMFDQGVISLKEHQNWFMKVSTKPEQYHLLILEKKGVSQGYISLEINKYNFVNWGFYKAPDADRGVGYDLGVEGLNYAFTKIQTHKVVGEVLEFNDRSIAFHTKLGFQQEGVLRDQYWHADCYFNIISFGLLASEWNKVGRMNYE